MAEHFDGGRPLFSGRPPVRYEDLISNELDTIHSTASTVLGHHVFAGNQPDDFAIGAFATRAPRVLLLGLGLGGSIRSILAANPAAEITALDFSDPATGLCRALHSSYFPNVRFHTVVADARDFPEHVEGTFDSICIDLYDEEGYPEFVFAPEFWAQVRAARSSTAAIVMTNAWGLPTHLAPLENSTPQAALADLMQSSLGGSVTALPHRRNLTLIAGRPNALDGVSVELDASSLRQAIDELQLRLLRLRARFALEVRERATVEQVTGAERTKTHLNGRMNDLWPAALRSLLAVGAEGRKAASLSELVASSPAVTAAATATKDDLRFFLPNVASNWIHQYGVLPRWFRDATEATHEQQIEDDLQVFILGWLTQYVALLIKCPVGLEYSQDLTRWVELAKHLIATVEGKVRM